MEMEGERGIEGRNVKNQFEMESMCVRERWESERECKEKVRKREREKPPRSRFQDTGQENERTHSNPPSVRFSA